MNNVLKIGESSFKDEPTKLASDCIDEALIKIDVIKAQAMAITVMMDHEPGTAIDYVGDLVSIIYDQAKLVRDSLANI